MPITAEDLKAFKPFASIQKQQQITVDMAKVVETLVTESAALATGEGDPVERVAALSKRVDDIDSMLAKATETETGIVVTADEALAKIAKEFEVDPPAPATPAAPTQIEETPAPEESDGVTKVAGSEDSEGWPRDLAPLKPPTSKAERLTKRERPIPARKGARRVIEKYDRARDRAMERKVSGAPERSTS